jgi:hypothetical protein
LLVKFLITVSKMNWFKVFLSSGCAFVISIVVALLIETLGGAIGSIIGTVPSTIIPSAYVMLTQADRTISERTDSLLGCVIGSFGTCVLFMPIWKVLPPKLPKKWPNGGRVFSTLGVSLVVWFVGAFLLVYLHNVLSKVGVSMYSFAICLALITSIFGAFLCWTLPPTPAGKNKVKWYIHLCRGLAAATAIFISGILSQTGAASIAGVVTNFPAIFATTMVSVSLAQGADVSTGAIGPLILGGIS